MRVLVCGSRDWRDMDRIWSILDQLHASVGVDCVIEGEARGADSYARNWAIGHYVWTEGYPADWRVYGKAGGPIRNEVMLREGRPDIVLAFHDNIAESKGTADMITRAQRKGIPVRLYTSLGVSFL